MHSVMPAVLFRMPGKTPILTLSNNAHRHADRTWLLLSTSLDNGNCLAVVNLKGEAKQLYQLVKELDVDHRFTLVHLSTAMCGAHRKNQLAVLKKCLPKKTGDSGQPVICISTQLIEAGVDISFSCVIRAMAGLDSILQAAGRCNRNGESQMPRNVYVYSIIKYLLILSGMSNAKTCV